MEHSDEQVLDAYPGAAIDHDNLAQYGGRLDHQLLINRCRECQRWHEPPRAICPFCWASDPVPTAVAGTGTVALSTVLHHGAPTPGVDYKAGYLLVGVELTEQQGLRVVAPLVERTGDERVVGTPVELVWLDRSGSPVPAFRPMER